MNESSRSRLEYPCVSLALTPAERVGPYEIVGPLGKGGMGEVYRARDTRLGREVALKLLADSAAQDTEHLARFERETHAVAALNHPNILAIHDTGSHRGVPYAITELLEGETLAERLRAGAIAPKRSTEIVCQIADGLAAAHVRGVIHRDIKPENIFLTNDGRTKILDFGIARIERPTTKVGLLTGTRTRGSSAYLLVGTAGYMSPEQVRGKPIDARTDIFSLGSVFFEVLTGRQAFSHESAVETFGAVLRDDPTGYPEAEKIPPDLRRFVFRCLEKDPADRYQSARDLLLDLRAYQAEALRESADRVQFRSEPPWRQRKKRVLLRAAGGVLLFALGLLAGRQWWPGGGRKASSLSRPSARFLLDLSPPPGISFWQRHAFAVSPDGSRLVYVADEKGRTRLYLRGIESHEAVPLPGTEDGDGPFFSPDGQWIGFFTTARLKKISVAGGAPVDVGAVPPVTRGASWGTDDTIVYTPANTTALWQVSAAGGSPRRLTSVNTGSGEQTHRWPEILPGGKAVVFTVGIGGSFDDARIVVQKIDGTERKVVIEKGTNARYVSTGHLVFARGGSLLAAPFDSDRLEVTGPAVPILQGVRTEATGAAQFAFSSAGVLFYMPGPAPAIVERSLLWVDRNGKSSPVMAARADYTAIRLSPDGRRLAFTVGVTDQNVWIHDFERGTSSRLTLAGSEEFEPVWAPDGSTVTYTSERNEREPEIFRLPADGSGREEKVAESKLPQVAQSWSPDGAVLALTEIHPQTQWDIWTLPREGDRRPRPFACTPFSEVTPDFAPNGRWIAYASNESGRFEIYAQPYPGPGRKVQISTDGGMEPVWSRDGRELFYNGGGKMMAVQTRFEPDFAAGTPKALFETSAFADPDPEFRQYDVSPDGKRFVMIGKLPGQSTPPRLAVILEWFSELARRAPAAR